MCSKSPQNKARMAGPQTNQPGFWSFAHILCKWDIRSSNDLDRHKPQPHRTISELNPNPKLSVVVRPPKAQPRSILTSPPACQGPALTYSYSHTTTQIPIARNQKSNPIFHFTNHQALTRVHRNEPNELRNSAHSSSATSESSQSVHRPFSGRFSSEGNAHDARYKPENICMILTPRLRSQLESRGLVVRKRERMVQSAK